MQYIRNLYLFSASKKNLTVIQFKNVQKLFSKDLIKLKFYRI